MKDIIIDSELVSYCGLYCGACKAYLKEKCPGCRTSGRFKKCKMRPCNIENNYRSCADCIQVKNVMDCKKYTNTLWNILEFIFRTKRSANIDFIKKNGYDSFAKYMSEIKKSVLKR